jgi:hypothetical protein
MHLKALAVLTLATSSGAAAQETSGWARIREVMSLPVRTTEAREWGVPEERVRTTIWDIRRGGVPAEDATRIFDEEVRIVREGGSKDNFGAFVHSRVEAGMRGRELADAIHAEHARRGMGKPTDAGRKQGEAAPGKQPDDARPGKPGDRDDDKPRDEAHGQGQGQGQGQGREAKPAGQAPGKAGDTRGKGRTP